MGAYISREPIFDPPDDDEVYDEVQRRVDAVVEAAVEWHQDESGDWSQKAEVLGNAIDALLELRDAPAPPMFKGDRDEGYARPESKSGFTDEQREALLAHLNSREGGK